MSSQQATSQPQPRSPLFRWRTERHLTQQQAAALFKITQGQYSQYELGKYMPRPSLLAKLTELSGQPMLGKAMAMHFYRITPEEAAWFFRMTETT